jgi:hypothetical protein
MAVFHIVKISRVRGSTYDRRIKNGIFRSNQTHKHDIRSNIFQFGKKHDATRTVQTKSNHTVGIKF